MSYGVKYGFIYSIRLFIWSNEYGLIQRSHMRTYMYMYGVQKTAERRAKYNQLSTTDYLLAWCNVKFAALWMRGVKLERSGEYLQNFKNDLNTFSLVLLTKLCVDSDMCMTYKKCLSINSSLGKKSN